LLLQNPTSVFLLFCLTKLLFKNHALCDRNSPLRADPGVFQYMSKSSSSKSTHEAPIPPNILAIVATISAVSLVIIVGGLVFYWRQRRRERFSEARPWMGGREEGTGATHVSGLSLDDSANTDGSTVGLVPISPSRIPDAPPTLPLPPGWPRRGHVGEKHSWRSEKRRRVVAEDLRRSRLMDDTPFENVEVDVDDTHTLAPSEAFADAGSIAQGLLPSRATSRRTAATTSTLVAAHAAPTSWRLAGKVRADNEARRNARRSGTSSLWSDAWSHRATQSEPESLPAYTVRRSQSTSRSIARAGTNDTTGNNGGGEVHLPNYPYDLGRRVAQMYSRSRSRSPLPPGRETPMPPGYI